MKRNVALSALVLALVVLELMALGQSSSQKRERPKAQAGTELVAWTQNQKAEPVPSTQATTPAQPQPDTQTPRTPAEGRQSDTEQQDDAQKHPAAQSFMGTIMKSGDIYVLQTSDDITYQLDDQGRVKEYEGKQVQVTGSLDKSTNTIKVRDIKQAA
jgi:hypothetical protein